jgi:hypothetical protein
MGHGTQAQIMRCNYELRAPHEGAMLFPLPNMETIMTNRNPQDQKHVQGQKQKDEDQRQKQQQSENPDRNQQGGFDSNRDRQQGSPDPVRHMPDQSR